MKFVYGASKKKLKENAILERRNTNVPGSKLHNELDGVRMWSGADGLQFLLRINLRINFSVTAYTFEISQNFGQKVIAFDE